MADVSTVTMPDGSVKDIKDSISRSSVSELVDNGAKNLLQNTAATQTVNEIMFTVNQDGTITANGTATANSSIAIYGNATTMLNKSLICSGCPENGSNTSYRCFVQKLSGGTYVTVATMTGDGIEFTLDTARYRYLITIYSGYRADNLVFKPMICTKAAWDISPAYQPYRKDLAELTVDSDEDRNALVELVDSGAKNGLLITADMVKAINPSESWSGNVVTKNNVVYTINADGTITCNITATASVNRDLIVAKINEQNIPSGTYELSGAASGAQLLLYQPGYDNQYDRGDGVSITYNSTVNGHLTVRIPSSVGVSTFTLSPMICTKAAWDISHAYQPNRPSEDEQNAQIALNKTNISNLDSRTGYGTVIPANADLNTYTTIGEYYVATSSNAATLSNLPDVAKSANGHLTVKGLNADSNLRLIQIWYCNFVNSATKGVVLMRCLGSSNTWTNWFQFSGVEIVPST